MLKRIFAFHPAISFFVFLTMLSHAFLAQTGTVNSGSTEMTPVVEAMCGKRVALLGESPTHGFGKTFAYKAELVRRLVEECHYNALFVESGVYDFLHIDQQIRSGQPATEEMVSAAIGGLWANKEVHSLIPFLTQKVREGTLSLGGMDDQSGRGSWAVHGLDNQMIPYLAEADKANCRSILQRHLLWKYTEDAPYSQADKASLLGCFDRIESGIASQEKNANPTTEEDLIMVRSLRRNISRDFTLDNSRNDSGAAALWNNARDLSMAENFRWLYKQLPANSKVIVWAATVHLAKENIPTNSRTPLGYYIRQQFGEASYALGFTALSGQYALGPNPAKPLSDAPPESLEARVFTGNRQQTVFLNRDELKRLGVIPGRVLGTAFQSAHWDELFDGLVVIREERVPEFLGK